MDRKFVITSLCYAIAGLALGIYMAASNNHGQFVTHAHIMLAGFVVSFIYGLCHKLWLHNQQDILALWQFNVHQLSVFVMSLGLFLLYGQFVSRAIMDPILAIASIFFLVAMILMAFMFVRVPPATSSTGTVED